MQAEIKNGKLIITIDAEINNPPASKSGKSLLIATTNGNIQTSTKVKGKNLVLSVNAYIANN